MDWRAKALIQKLLSAAPFGERLNNTLQLKVGGLRGFDAHVKGKVGDWIGMMNLLAECGVDARNAATVEIGTGWFPTLPLCFWLAGAESCVTFDLSRHLNLELTRRLGQALASHLESIANAATLSHAAVRERYLELGTDTLVGSHTTYIAPGDAAQTRLPAKSVDIVFSNSVLEHVSTEALPAIMRETRRILKPSGVAVHCVACNDHYAHFDRNISYVNFLRFSGHEWRWWNSSLQYQNRLRASDFLRVTEDCDFEVIAARKCVRAGVESALRDLPIAPEFKKYSWEDLATTTVNFVCRTAA